jgi:carbohydrate kinase (thermoresistant glucokinase family)
MVRHGASRGEDPAAPPPVAAIVMGVSGSGKSTVGAQLAARLGWEFADGDVFHPPANIAKMRNGIALDDADRWPWLQAIAAFVNRRRHGGGHCVVACSALKRRYRDVLIGDRRDVRLVYLKGEEALIFGRIAARRQHFMPAQLLHSQFLALEEPSPEEDPITVSVVPEPDAIVTAILAELGCRGKPAAE